MIAKFELPQGRCRSAAPNESSEGDRVKDDNKCPKCPTGVAFALWDLTSSIRTSAQTAVGPCPSFA